MPPVKKIDMTRPCYMGIDPGLSGGIAILFADDNHGIYPMSDNLKSIWRQIDEAGKQLPNLFAAIEKVQGYIGGAGTGHSMFKFGQNYGSLLMALTAAGIPFEEVPPQRWQKGLSIPSKKKDESKSDWKRRLKDKASKLFPQCDVTLKTADALLIAEYCRRQRTGTL